MKRLNPETNKPFKFGDTRSDGYKFLTYYPHKIKRDGYCAEGWLHPDKFESNRLKNVKHSRSTRQTLHGRMLALLHATQCNSQRRGHNTPTITIQDIHTLWEKQGGLCAYTGWPMGFATKSDRLVSLERIDNNVGYTPDNILLVCWCVNRARSDMTQPDFFAMCRAVVDNVS